LRWLVTGGAGFIGTNTVLKLAELGEQIEIIDNLSRPGVSENADYIESVTGLSIKKLDISKAQEIKPFLKEQQDFDVILNLAGQVSLLESIRDPIRDFEVNTVGPLNFLEHLRNNSPETLFINMSSNKVYGSLDYLDFHETETRYTTSNYTDGFSEDLKLDFHGPYGCSKGAADQYLNDYRRIYGLRTISLRQSAVYGPFQKPMSDQGWTAFMIQEIVAGRPIVLNGIGKQVRDLLHVEDLINLFISLSNLKGQIETTSYNVGGGATNQISILELFNLLEKEHGLKATYTFGNMRPGDQKFFVSSNNLISSHTNWKPTTIIMDGIKSMVTASQQR
jgi:CDP-paratose 2-epimerase